MEDKIGALRQEGGAKPAPNTYPIRPKDRLVLAGVLGFCFLAVDMTASARAWGMGVTAAAFWWYGLLLADRGRALFAGRESRTLLVSQLLLAVTFTLGSNPWFRWWNLLALLLLSMYHTCGLCRGAEAPWHHPWMLCERPALLMEGLLNNLGAAPAALSLKGRRMERAGVWLLGGCLALALVIFLLPVLISADALFALTLDRFFAFLGRYLAEGLWKLAAAAALTPFLFGLLYSLRREADSMPPPAVPKADGAPFVVVLAALDGLYLLFLAVQSAGLFGGPAYLEARGLSYAQWARSGFFQMTTVTAVNLTALLAAVTLARRQRGLRPLAAVLAAESLVLLASAAWRMTLYVSAYGLSFKRLMTYWGMAMMTLFLLAALRKVWRPERSFLRAALPMALAGWLAVNCVPMDLLTARDQVERYLSGESPAVSAEYLLKDLSYDVLPQLERLDGGILCETGGRKPRPLEELIEERRAEARAECADWRSWNLSAQIAAMG